MSDAQFIKTVSDAGTVVKIAEPHTVQPRPNLGACHAIAQVGEPLGKWLSPVFRDVDFQDPWSCLHVPSVAYELLHGKRSFPRGAKQ